MTYILITKKIIRVIVLWSGMSMLILMIMQHGFGSQNLQIINQSVISEIIDRWPATIELGMLAMLLAIVVGIPFGIIAALNYKNIFDHLLISTSLLGYSMPIFWWSLILILFFSVGFNITPVSGRLDVMYDVVPITGFMLVDTLLPKTISEYHLQAFYSAVLHLILPTIALASMPIAVLARMTRASLLEVFAKDYILAARAKGLSEYRVILIHAFRNALPTILSTAGVLFISTVIMGSVVVEVIFAWPGIGSYIIQSVYAKDHEVVQLFLLMVGTIVIITNALLDLMINSLNPRKG